ncbi:hypothetical protein Pmani_002447 [Petrolisthes manimaculis]|uniref:Uncharacterized protein n=1 Tax=Petrolisthes manimaculis TaxID=1843537 RepID=A0AAE1QKC1_9EUCA|nr:hypothetical protein Pmani_002447 [Petrolisthes manimaculis]
MVPSTSPPLPLLLYPSSSTPPPLPLLLYPSSPLVPVPCLSCGSLYPSFYPSSRRVITGSLAPEDDRASSPTDTRKQGR